MLCSNGQPLPSSREEVDRLHYKAHENLIPLNAMIELTYRCNVDCVHCYCQHLNEPVIRPELTTREWIDVVDHLADLGTLYLSMTGGEILMRPDFWEIAFHAKKRHFAIILFTNCTMVTEKVADRLAELRPMSIETSLLHPDEEKHDLLAKRQGSYKKIIRAAGYLRERRLPFVMKTTLFKQNADRVKEVYELGMSLGARKHRIGTIFSPKNDGDLSPLAVTATDEQVRDFFLSEFPNKWEVAAEMSQEERHGKGTCGAATTSIAINPYGDILPCIQLFLSFGNVREKSLREAWENPPPALRGVRRTQSYGELPECRGCELIGFCNRCHGLALLETGRWDAKYRQACAHAQIGKEVNEAVKQREAPAPKVVVCGAGCGFSHSA